MTSVGCNNGDDPTVQHSRVNSLDRFLDPTEQRSGNAADRPHAPWNLQVAGQPIIGRSGGGLFSADGMVIGVCNAAEPEDHEGLFAALGSIHAALDQQGLTSLYKQAVAPPALVPPLDSTRSALVAVDPFSAGRTAASRVRIPSQATPAGRLRPTAAMGDRGSARIDQRPCRAGQRRAGSHGKDPPPRCTRVRRWFASFATATTRKPRSEVITLDRDCAGLREPAFQCRAAAKIPTSMEVPKRPTPILEWDIETGWRHQGPLP